MNDMPTADLIARQLELEESSSVLGIARYRKNLERTGTAESAPGRALIKRSLDAVRDGITEFVDDALGGKPGRRHVAVQWFRVSDPDALAYLTCVHCVGVMGESQPRLSAVAMSLGTEVFRNLNYDKFKATNPGLHRVIQKQLLKSTSARHSVSVMNHAMNTAKVAVDVYEADESTMLRVGMALIDIFVNKTGLLALDTVRLRATNTTHILRTTDAAAEWLEQAHNTRMMFNPVWLPMLVPPKPWTNATDGGYLTNIGGRNDLVRTRNAAYKAELNEVDMPNVYAALNAIQATPWSINKAVLEVMEQCWEEGNGLGGLPLADPEPLPPVPAGLAADPDYYKEHHADEFKKWKRARTEVYESNAKLKSLRYSAQQKIDLARKFKDEAAIYFPHNLDFRGRCYPIPAFLSPQGDDAAKALLHFAEGVPLGEDGAYWLAIHIANCFGVDKVPFRDRVKWVYANEEAILDSALNPMDGQRMWATADSPFCALAACFEWMGYCLSGNDHLSRIAVALDGSCNGLQNFSAMLRDSIGGAATNLIPQDKPADIYTAVMRVAAIRVTQEASAGDENAIYWDGQLCRGIVKQPVMTLPYGVTRAGMTAQVLVNARKEGLKPTDDACKYLAGVLWDCIGQVVVAARHAMDWLKDAAKVASKSDAPIYWTTPAGFPVLQDYREAAAARQKVHMGGKEIDISRAVTTSQLDSRRQALGISPNFVHSCDASHMMLTVVCGLDNGLTSFAMIHDSYGTHAGRSAIMAAALRQAFIDQYCGDVLQMFRDTLAAQLPPEAAEKLPELPPTGDLDLNAVHDSLYFFA